MPTPSLNYLASLHLRGDLVFPVPSIVRYSPVLIGYYRMLLGLSKKEFSQRNKLGYGPWVGAEQADSLSPRLINFVEEFCQALIIPLAEMLDRIRLIKGVTAQDLGDLALLTLGPTLQAGEIT